MTGIIFFGWHKFSRVCQKLLNVRKFFPLKYTTYEFTHQKGRGHSERLCFPDLYCNFREFHSKIQNIRNGTLHHICHTKSNGFHLHHPILPRTHCKSTHRHLHLHRLFLKLLFFLAFDCQDVGFSFYSSLDNKSSAPTHFPGSICFPLFFCPNPVFFEDFQN